VGGYWGLFSADREETGVRAGPVRNLPGWPLWLGLSGVILLGALLVGGRPASARSAFLLPLAGALGAGCIGLWLELSVITSRFWGEWLWAAALTGLNLLVLLHICLTLSARAGWRAQAFDALQRRAGLWLAAAGFAGAVLMLGMVFDARYRSFPSAALLFPALVYLCRPVVALRRETWLLALIIAVGIPAQLALEGLSNLQALGWAAVSLLLLGALWRGMRAQRTM
jgi:hypothetical protein